MTRAEYEATYGALPTATPAPIQTGGITNLFTGENAEQAFVNNLGAQPAPIKMTRAEYAAKYEQPLSPSQLFTGGVTNLLSAGTFNLGDEIISALSAPVAAGMSQFTDSPMGISEAYNKILPDLRIDTAGYQKEYPIQSLIQSIPGALAMPTLGLASKVGKVLPAAKTLPQALSNTGYKSAAMAAEGGLLGGAYGYGKGTGSIENRIEQATEGAKTGAKYGALLGLPSSAISEGIALKANKVKEIGEDMQRFAYGARSADYNKTTRELDYFDIAEDQVESLTKESMNDLIKRGIFGKDTNPAKTTAAVIKERVLQSKKLRTLINLFDKKSKAEVPAFSRAKQLVEEGKVPANEADRYLNEIEQLQEAIKNKGKGKLSYLQAQKEALRGKYVEGDLPRNLFNKALYHDLQKAVEGYVPEAAGINKELQKLLIVEPIVKKGLGKAEAVDWIDSIFQRLRTSGAKTIMGPAVGAAALASGASVPAAIGAAALGYAANPDKMAKIGRGVEALAANPASVTNLAEKSLPLVGMNSVPKQKRSLGNLRPQGSSKKQTAIKRTEISPSLKPEPKSATSQKVSYTPEKIKEITKDLPPVVKAIIKVESNYNPRAKSNKGAQGLMQLMPEMQKAFDVKDPYDPVQNVNAGIKLLKEEMDRFKDNKLLAIAAYNAGSPKVERAIKRAGSRSWARVRPFLPSETQNYVTKVLAETRRV